jgi:hypothetical protein
MKKVLGILGIALSLISCSAEPYQPTTPTQTDKKISVNLDWDCNGIEPSAEATIYLITPLEDGTKVVHYDNIDKHTVLSLFKGDVIEFSVKSGADKGIQPNPHSKIQISIKTIDYLKILYENEADTNGIGVVGIVVK